MMFNSIGNLIRFLTILCLCHVILALYDTSKTVRYPVVNTNQRSADSGYKYAWFTRDIHDDDDDDWSKDNEYQSDESSRQLLRLKLLKNIFNRKSPNHDENYFQ